MTDPKRMLEGGTELEARLLGSALDDAPAKGLGRRVQAALGVSGIAIGAGTATTSAAAASKAVPLLMSVGVAKWVGIVALGTGAAVGVAVVHREAESQRASVRSASPGVIAAAPTVIARRLDTVPSSIPYIPPVPLSPPPLAPAPPLAPPPVVQDRVALAPPPAPSPPLVRAAVPAETAEELVSELALLDRAHRALDSDDTQLALSTLDRRDLEFVHGDLAPESLALRIEAYAQRRDEVKVRELGQSFLSRYPTHPQVRRVQSLMDGSARP
jgi:hypothetical protein